MNSINPCQLNAAIAAIANQLYCSMKRDDLINLGVFLSMLSKDILSMAALEELLKWEHRDLREERLREEAKQRREEREAERQKAEQEAKDAQAEK
ncbi:MAG: hypothetical protein FWE32_08925 [Oscillospiraceae bacterium]|nr:hypothetical protein [Oscillospiraceae bacterium]